MYMRGWSGKGRLPIRRAPQEDQDTIDGRVTEMLNKLESYVESRQLKSVFMDLKLYNRVDGYWITEEREGFRTVGELITNIRNPSAENLEACIRTGSNWLTSTAYFYLDLLGSKITRFNIDDLKHIS